MVPDPPPEIPDDEHPPPADAGAAPDARPADRCRRHLGVEDPPACRACQRAREDVERWDRDRSVADRRSASSAARQRAELAVAAIAACGMCDDDGYRGGSLCRHDPDQARRAATGMAAVRAALAQRNAS